MGKLHIFKGHYELLETITELESDIQQWISFNKDKEHQIYLLENELKEYRKLQSECHKDIERVWQFDVSEKMGEEFDTSIRIDLIHSVFYKIANQWID